jgi:hypothetical protein
MPQVRYVVDVAADTTLVTTAETVLATLSGVQSQKPGQTVFLEGDVILTTGTTTSAVVVRIREDSLTGTLVDEAETDVAINAAGSTDPYRITAQHSPTGELSNKTYVLTASMTSATANGTAVHASLTGTVSP